MLGIAVLSTFSIALTARPISAENFICNALDLISEQDCDVPAAPVLQAPANGAFLQDNAFNFTWSPVDDISGVTYKICVSSDESFISAPTTCSEAVSETSYPAASLITNENQTIYWRVTATDGANNMSGPSENRSLTIDTDSPVVILNASPVLIGGTTPKTTITGRTTDDHRSEYTLEVTNEDGDIVDSVSASLDATETTVDISHEWDATAQPSGLYTVTLSATDKAGRNAVVSVIIEVDNSGPDLVIEGSKVIKGGSISPAVTTSDAHGIASYKWVADKTNSGPIIFDDSVKEPEFTPKIQGNYIFTLTVTDELGNSSSDDFEFGYATELETLPLPEATEKTSPPNVPAAIPPSSNPTRDPREDTEPDDKQSSQVLGTTSGSPSDPLAASNVAVLTPTDNGWSILGILWYWWLAAIVGVAAAWIALKRFLSSQAS